MKQLEIELETLEDVPALESTTRYPVLHRTWQDPGSSMYSVYGSERDHLWHSTLSKEASNSSVASTFIGPGSAIDLGLATATIAGLDMLEPSFPMDSVLQLSRISTNLLEAEKLNRSVIEPSLVRGLIDTYYFPILHQLYPVVEPSQLDFDIQIKQLPPKKRLFVVLTAAIAAAHRSRCDQSMHTIALILRSWADELVSEVVSRQDDDSLQAMVLLIFYELVDPRRKLIWHLLGLACQMCIRLRWHREDESEQLSLSYVEPELGLASHLSRYQSHWRRRLFHIIYEWER